MKLIFRGVVQGVGFRPTIYRVATSLGLKGYVLNKGSEVEVVIDRDVNRFIQQVRQQLPAIAEITDIQQIPDGRVFQSFSISHSADGERKSQIPADISICNDCIQELFNEKNRRYQFPFTNCTVCGARFSVIDAVPYDRERTAMKPFTLCADCQHDYEDIENRRYHAQTISCPICGPMYHLFTKKGDNLGKKNAIQQFAKHLDNGNIGVIKSWGGMHLCCKLSELPRFRKWYGRPQKSFAVMMRDISTVHEFGNPTSDEEQMLLSNKRPIVPIKKKKGELASPGLNTLGVFLPYTGLHYLLFSFLKANCLVMTSANLPGEPMMTENSEVFSLGADYYLLHNRAIVNRVDDSVVRLWKNRTFFLRKSRGYVPLAVPIGHNKKVVCVGAGENIHGAVSVDNKVFMTQYVGNASYYQSVDFLDKSLRHLIGLVMKDECIDAVGLDKHPGYDSRRVALRFAEEFSVPFFEVQHHWAHAVALLVDTVIDEGVVLTLDGLGFGDDGTFWGGEVLRADMVGFDRIGHLGVLPLIGGDKATVDPRRLVFGIFGSGVGAVSFTDKETVLFEKMVARAPVSSSMGRYLDALACYFGVCLKRTYSGEPAMKLEKYLAVGKPRFDFDVSISQNVVDVKDLFFQLNAMMQKKMSEKTMADMICSFVDSVVEGLCCVAVSAAENSNLKYVGLTGGVSYNVPIVEMVDRYVRKAGLKLVVHNHFPNGDGCISVGQNGIVGHKIG